MSAMTSFSLELPYSWVIASLYGSQSSDFCGRIVDAVARELLLLLPLPPPPPPPYEYEECVKEE